MVLEGKITGISVEKGVFLGFSLYISCELVDDERVGLVNRLGGGGEA